MPDASRNEDAEGLLLILRSLIKAIRGFLADDLSPRQKLQGVALLCADAEEEADVMESVMDPTVPGRVKYLLLDGWCRRCDADLAGKEGRITGDMVASLLSLAERTEPPKP